MSDWTSWFEAVAGAVLKTAGLFKAAYVPGLVVSVLLLALAVAMFRFWRWTRERLLALDRAHRIVIGQQSEPDEDQPRQLVQTFHGRVPEVTKAFRELGESGSGTARRLAFAWREYRDTLTEDLEQRQMLNGIRPAVFFNEEDLDAVARGWRILPSLFVSFGLAATFFGLIAALQQTSTTLSGGFGGGSPASAGDGTSFALQQLLDIASAKFIMSLTGLLCSIVLTMNFRRRLSVIEYGIDRLCVDIEKRIRFIGLESMAFEQLKLIQAQKDDAQRLNTELIAGLGKPLREELPAVIAQSISDAITPVLDRVGQAGTDNVRGVADELASQFSGEISRAIGEAAERFESAAARIEGMADALRDSGSRANGDIEKCIGELARTMTEVRENLSAGAADTRAAFATGSSELLERMNDSLGAIRQTLEASNDGQRAAAESIGAAAAAFAERVDEAGVAANEKIARRGAEAGEEVARQFVNVGENVSSSLAEALGPLVKQARELADETAASVVRPMRDLSSALDGFVSRVERGSGQFESLSTSIHKGADAAERGAESMTDASGALVRAAEPVSKLAKGLSSSAQSTASAADRIGMALDGQRDVIAATMTSLSSSLAAFQDVLDRYDNIDEKLGAAFQIFQEQVDESIARLADYSVGVHDKYADALQTLKTVVDGAADYRPTQRP